MTETMTFDDSFIFSRWPEEQRETIRPSAELIQKLVEDLDLSLGTTREKGKAENE